MEKESLTTYCEQKQKKNFLFCVKNQRLKIGGFHKVENIKKNNFAAVSIRVGL